ncbi:hypothetical protein EI94DRAFT_1744341 [Lactarius quietus]|nr:hypothetical protein EI94DRAFT_1744341 [Lactarius quietus]
MCSLEYTLTPIHKKDVQMICSPMKHLQSNCTYLCFVSDLYNVAEPFSGRQWGHTCQALLLESCFQSFPSSMKSATPLCERIAGVSLFSERACRSRLVPSQNSLENSVGEPMSSEDAAFTVCICLGDMRCDDTDVGEAGVDDSTPGPRQSEGEVASAPGIQPWRRQVV